MGGYSVSRIAPRRICYVSGTRADFGLMRATLARIQEHADLSLEVVVTGMHLSEAYGMTCREIEAAGFPIVGRVPCDMRDSSGVAMARNLATTLAGCVELFAASRPDLVLLLGDRGEMLAAALAGLHLNIPLVHVHGGERSGTVDEPVRHAISKLSHYHFTATEEARERLIAMGETPGHVFVTGAPGIDELAFAPRLDRCQLCRQAGFDPDLPLALMVYHPVLQEAERAGAEVSTLMDVLLSHGMQVMALMPNADAGSDQVRAALACYAVVPSVRLHRHIERNEFLAWMAACDVMVGNSSSGIIEAASFGTPVVNVGSRQHLRERNANVIDIEATPAALIGALAAVQQHGRHEPCNRYGDGHAGERMVQLLTSLDLSDRILRKVNEY